jgi:hypothetical protein
MKQRGDIIVELLIYGAIAAAALFALHTAWSSFTGHYVAQGAAAQLADDTRVLEGVKTDLAQWKQAANDRQAETQACVDKASKQNAAVDDLAKRYDAAVSARKAIEAAAKRDNAAKEQTIAQLQAKAAAPPVKDMACADELAKAKAILQDTLRTRRAPAAVPK